MYLPAYAKVEDEAVMFDLMRRFSFALLVTSDEDGMPFATPLPLVVHEERQVIHGHVAKANPQWQHLQRLANASRHALVVFQGDHAYISPSWYETRPRVPTWNYVTVHAKVQPRLLDEHASRLHLEELVAQHEQGLTQPWNTGGLSDTYMAGMMKALVAFELQIVDLQGKFKLGQNGPQQDRVAAGKTLQGRDNTSEQTIGKMMEDAP